LEVTDTYSKLRCDREKNCSLSFLAIIASTNVDETAALHNTLSIHTAELKLG